jgi:hypothetical protein
VGTIRAKLNLEDAALLSDSALAMIFDNADGEMSLAVLEAGLSDAQRESLKQIYLKFTHNEVPKLEEICSYDSSICFVSIAYYSFNSEICILRQCEWSAVI